MMRDPDWIREMLERGAVPHPSARDREPERTHTEAMTEITRPELDAKLELIESRMDARIARIEASVAGFKEEAGQLRAELSNAKWWAIGTAIAVLGIFLGALQWGLSMQKEENARFSGYIREDVKSIGDDVSEMSKSLTEMRILLERQKPPATTQ